MKYLCRVLGISSSLLFVGCAHTQYDLVPAEVGQPSITHVSDAAADQIAEAASSVSQSLTSLEAVEKANMAPQAAKMYPTVGQVPVPGVSSVDWNGPIEPLVRQIAKACGYRLKVIGEAPITPVIVTVHQQQASNADILRSAGLQAGNRATVTANSATKVIELRYLGR